MISFLPTSSFSTKASLGRIADVIVCGAGFSGISTAFHLAKRHQANVIVIDEFAPLSLTSSVSTEAYRNYWPGNRTMSSFINHSIDLMEKWQIECDHIFPMSSNGYLFVSKDSDRFKDTEFIHRTIGNEKNRPSSILLNKENLHTKYKFLNPELQSGLFVERAGWTNAHLFGSSLMDACKECNVLFRRGKVMEIHTKNDHEVNSITITTENGKEILHCKEFINASGPYLSNVHDLTPSNIPIKIENRIHAKVIMKDSMKLFPQNSPMVIDDDGIQLHWTEEERESLLEMGEFMASLTRMLPSGVHIRPYPPHHVLMLWEFMHLHQEVPSPPLPFPDLMCDIYPEIVVRGLYHLIPEFEHYIESIPSCTSVDGGYYSMSLDGLPLIGRVDDLQGYSLCGGFAGYGLMGCMAAGELLANDLNKSKQDCIYENAFDPMRFLKDDYVPNISVLHI